MATKKKQKKLTKLFIDRSKWFRGADEGLLRNSQGKMCCLGFVAMACGARTDRILNVGEPENLPRFSWPEGFLTTDDEGNVWNSTIVEKLIDYNDSSGYSDKKRESLIKSGFKKLGIDVEFIGE